MSTEEPPAPNEVPREPEEQHAPPLTPRYAAPGAASEAASEMGRGMGSLTPLIAIVAAIVVIAGGYFVVQNASMFTGAREAQSYSVAPYAPQGEIIAARERVEARAAPDATAPIVVVFGQGATINVTGRVSRGLGNDWYAISWNNRTAFIRQSDAISGSGAPPTPEVRQPEPEEEKEKPAPEEFPNVEDEVVEAPPQSSGQLEISDVDWAREPNARDFARYYPSEALDRGRSGRVVLDCVIAGSGRLDCSIAQESPGGQGFGDAALSISRQVRVRSRLLDGSPAQGRHLRLPLAFRAR